MFPRVGHACLSESRSPSRSRNKGTHVADESLEEVRRQSSWRLALRSGRVSAKRGAKAFEIVAEKANVPAHHAQMGNLPALDPEINRLRADAEKSGGLGDAPGNILRGVGPGSGRNGRRRTGGFAFRRNDLQPAEQRRLSGLFGFCGCPGCFQQVQFIPHTRPRFSSPSYATRTSFSLP